MTRPARHQLITIEDASLILGVPTSTIRGWVHRGLIERHGSARASLFAWDDLARMQERRATRRCS